MELALYDVDRDVLQGIPAGNAEALLGAIQPTHRTFPLWYDGDQDDRLNQRMQIPAGPAWDRIRAQTLPNPIPPEPQFPLESLLEGSPSGEQDADMSDVPPALEPGPPSVLDHIRHYSPTLVNSAFSFGDESEMPEVGSEPELGQIGEKRKRTGTAGTRAKRARKDDQDPPPPGDPVSTSSGSSDFWPAVVITALILGAYLVLDAYEGPSGRSGRGTGGSRGSYY